jgi:tetratricopeptide (TPR) repeat protein
MNMTPVSPWIKKQKNWNALFLGMLFLGLGLWSGCASTSYTPLSTLPSDLSPSVELNEVPFYPQEDRQCGPASLAMALEASGLEVNFETLKSQVFTPGRAGTLPPDMVGGARRHGRVAYPIRSLSDLLQEVEAGHPVIVLQQLKGWFKNDWHYAVVVGFDLEKRELLLRSGNRDRLWMSIEKFEETWQAWKRWGLLILSPEDLPATGEAGIYLKAVLGLEQVRKFAQAEQAYARAVERWPDNLTGWMGLGNSRYAQKNLKGAEEAFRAATRATPEAGVAFNNLAHVLAERGRREEALQAARKAVALGGPQQSIFSETLKEIQNSP